MKTLQNKIQFTGKMENCARWIIIGLLLLTVVKTNAQQEPTYTQYMFNTQTINPAYAGTWGTTGFMVLAREQWTGIDNAPSTQTLSFQTLHNNKNVGLGLNVINDRYGLEKRFSIFGDYSYQVNMSQDLKLRLGLKLGFSSYSHNLGNHNVIDPNDPLFMGELDRNFLPNFGVGAFLYEESYYVGLSLPKLVNNEIKNNVNNFSTQAEMRHLFLMGGYVFNLSESVKFKPTFLTKFITGAPIQTDLTANFLIADKVWLGAMVRTGESFGALAQWIINNQLRFGYSVDFITSELSSYQNGTHEVMISYEFGRGKDQILSTRLY